MYQATRALLIAAVLLLGLGIIGSGSVAGAEPLKATPTRTRTPHAEGTNTLTRTSTPIRTSTVTSTRTLIPTVTRTGTPAPPTATPVPSLMKVGFNVGGGHQSVALDLAAIHGSVYANFCCPLSTTVIPGATNMHILRYNASCPGMVMYGCIETIAQLSAFVSANRGMTWELGNEPGNGGQDSLSGIAAWERNVYAAIKGADSSAFVLGPGVLNWDSGKATLYQSMTVDGVAFHIYQSDDCMGSQWLPQAKSIIDGATTYAKSVGKPAWMTETSDFPGCSPPAATRQANIAALKAYLASHGVKAAIWFSEGDLHLGYGTGFLFNTDNSLTSEAKAWSN